MLIGRPIAIIYFLARKITAEYAESAEESENQSEDLNGLKTLRHLHFSAVIKHSDFQTVPHQEYLERF